MKTATCTTCNEDVPVIGFAHIALYKHIASKHTTKSLGVKKNASTKVQKKTSSD